MPRAAPRHGPHEGEVGRGHLSAPEGSSDHGTDRRRQQDPLRAERGASGELGTRAGIGVFGQTYLRTVRTRLRAHGRSALRILLSGPHSYPAHCWRSRSRWRKSGECDIRRKKIISRGCSRRDESSHAVVVVSKRSCGDRAAPARSRCGGGGSPRLGPWVSRVSRVSPASLPFLWGKLARFVRETREIADALQGC